MNYILESAEGSVSVNNRVINKLSIYDDDVRGDNELTII